MSCSKVSRLSRLTDRVFYIFVFVAFFFPFFFFNIEVNDNENVSYCCGQMFDAAGELQI